MSPSNTNTAAFLEQTQTSRDINVEVSQCCFAKSPLLKCHCHTNCYINGQFSTFFMVSLFFLFLFTKKMSLFTHKQTYLWVLYQESERRTHWHNQKNGTINLLLLFSFHISQSHTLLDNSTDILLSVWSFSG